MASFARHVPEYDMPVVMVNEAESGGSGGTISVLSAHSSSRGIVEHEIGHSVAGLVDEYDIDYMYYTIEAPNNTAVTNPTNIRWKDWIEVGTQIPTPENMATDAKVGLFDGSMYQTSGWYRSSYNSLMKSRFRPPGEVNRHEFVLSIYRNVDPIEASQPVGAIPLGPDPANKVVSSEHVMAALPVALPPSETYLMLTVLRRFHRDDVDHIEEVCGNLSDWMSGSGETVTLMAIDELLVVRDTVPYSAGVERFIRLKVVEK